ncbi:MAG: spore coat U domain-containing protein [Methylobacter sp.]|uniref:Csu type fimbrial protein n=1 Tax=Methylobacter sp. TaxID=2051955 RepID=UPI0025EA7D93|nr:spore coat U domain-containing protein [Methylobacter sp.]MCK9623147.1 spore coat U domain-containing protein [Methylobacter sp.]
MKQFIYYQRPAVIADSGSHTAGKRFFAAILALALGGMAGSAYGLGESCNVSSSGVNFGVYDVFSTNANDAAGNIQVACTNGLISLLVSYNIRLSTGGGSYASRSMASGGSHSLSYNLYTDSNHSIVWGDGSAGTGIRNDGYLLGILSTVTRNYPVYGRIPALQNAYVGIYSDTITMTVNY